MYFEIRKWWFACVLILIGSVNCKAGDGFISGGDFSHLAFFESNGVVYKDSGIARDALTIIGDKGLNCVRLRLFTSSAAQALTNPYNCINNLEYTVPLAVRVKNAGLRFILDFHYSDTWADPGKQTKPEDWAGLTYAELLLHMRTYNSNCIAAFRQVGAMPDYVQIGNEITGGMLWPDGRVGGSYDTPTQWSKLGQLIKAAIQGVRDAAAGPAPTIIVHIDRGGSWSGTQWFFDRLQLQQIDFDMIGLSYYPFWHGSLDDLRTCLVNTTARYSKPVVVAETAFPWAGSTNIYGIPANAGGQVEYLAALTKMVRSLPNGLGAGIVWWGAEYQSLAGYNLAGFDRRSFFSSDGNALPIVTAFGGLVAPLRLEAKSVSGGLSLMWPLSGAAHSIFETTKLLPGTTWSLVTNSPQTVGTGLGISVPVMTNSTRFYRLQGR